MAGSGVGGSPELWPCLALLLDLDGVLVDSMGVVHRTWRRWAQLRALDPLAVAAASRGGPAVETIRRVAPHLDAVAEAAHLSELEAAAVDQVRAFDGAAELLRPLAGRPAAPPDWAIVTSGTRRVAEGRIERARLPRPPVLLTADDTRRGKPDPECYRRAAELLAAPPDRCVVVEDSPGGIEAGRAAGMRVIAVASSRTASELRGAHVVVGAATCLSVTLAQGGLVLEARDPVYRGPDSEP